MSPLTRFDAFGLFAEDIEFGKINPEPRYSPQDYYLIHEDTYDVYDNPRNWFGNSPDDWRNTSLRQSYNDFTTGFSNGVSNPVNTFCDIGRPEFINKSHPTIAGEVFGVGANLLAAKALEISNLIPYIANTSMSLIARGFNYCKGAFNPRVAQNVAQVSKIATIEPQGIRLAVGKIPKIESQVWSINSKRNSVENALFHWNKHRNEFPHFQNAKQYVECARNLLKNPPSNTFEKIRENGEIVRYCLSSNTYGTYTKQGIPQTLFKIDLKQHKYKTFRMELNFWGKDGAKL